ncbi:MAG TPA: hypothetical protein VES89_05910 [Candidatus Competibacteraceae bacterium]|nr:hypothetical protein [Candidatus Competibacteraceae bacterium]
MDRSAISDFVLKHCLVVRRAPAQVECGYTASSFPVASVTRSPPDQPHCDAFRRLCEENAALFGRDEAASFIPAVGVDEKQLVKDIVEYLASHPDKTVLFEGGKPETWAQDEVLSRQIAARLQGRQQVLLSDYYAKVRWNSVEFLRREVKRRHGDTAIPFGFEFHGEDVQLAPIIAATRQVMSRSNDFIVQLGGETWQKSQLLSQKTPAWTRRLEHWLTQYQASWVVVAKWKAPILVGYLPFFLHPLFKEPVPMGFFQQLLRMQPSEKEWRVGSRSHLPLYPEDQERILATFIPYARSILKDGGQGYGAGFNFILTYPDQLESEETFLLERSGLSCQLMGINLCMTRHDKVALLAHCLEKRDHLHPDAVKFLSVRLDKMPDIYTREDAMLYLQELAGRYAEPLTRKPLEAGKVYYFIDGFMASKDPAKHNAFVFFWLRDEASGEATRIVVEGLRNKNLYPVL